MSLSQKQELGQDPFLNQEPNDMLQQSRQRTFKFSFDLPLQETQNSSVSDDENSDELMDEINQLLNLGDTTNIAVAANTTNNQQKKNNSSPSPTQILRRQSSIISVSPETPSMQPKKRESYLITPTTLKKESLYNLRAEQDFSQSRSKSNSFNQTLRQSPEILRQVPEINILKDFSGEEPENQNAKLIGESKDQADHLSASRSQSNKASQKSLKQASDITGKSGKKRILMDELRSVASSQQYSNVINSSQFQQKTEQEQIKIYQNKNDQDGQSTGRVIHVESVKNNVKLTSKQIKEQHRLKLIQIQIDKQRSYDEAQAKNKADFQAAMTTIFQIRDQKIMKRRYSAPKCLPRIAVERNFESNILGFNLNQDAIALCLDKLPFSIDEPQYDSLAFQMNNQIIGSASLRVKKLEQNDPKNSSRHNTHEYEPLMCDKEEKAHAKQIILGRHLFLLNLTQIGTFRPLQEEYNEENRKLAIQNFQRFYNKNMEWRASLPIMLKCHQWQSRIESTIIIKDVKNRQEEYFRIVKEQIYKRLQGQSYEFDEDSIWTSKQYLMESIPQEPQNLLEKLCVLKNVCRRRRQVQNLNEQEPYQIISQTTILLRDVTIQFIQSQKSIISQEETLNKLKLDIIEANEKKELLKLKIQKAQLRSIHLSNESAQKIRYKNQKFSQFQSIREQKEVKSRELIVNLEKDILFQSVLFESQMMAMEDDKSRYLHQFQKFEELENLQKILKKSQQLSIELAQEDLCLQDQINQVKPMCPQFLNFVYKKDIEPQYFGLEEITQHLNQLQKKLEENIDHCQTVEMISKFLPTTLPETANKIRNKDLKKFKQMRYADPSKKLLVKDDSKIIVENWREVVESKLVALSNQQCHSRPMSQNSLVILIPQLPLEMNRTQQSMLLPDINQKQQLLKQRQIQLSCTQSATTTKGTENIRSKSTALFDLQ